jgi:hypothetical protein
MTQFDQRYQQVDTQYNAGRDINVYQPPLSLTERQRKQNRARMLDRVQSIWIKGVLEPSMQGAAQIALELQNKPSAIVTPLWQVLREFDKTGPLSSAESSFVQVYDQANGEVLILGEPGAGKTTLLLDLARALLERAHQDEAHPIPVVFSLSSWATRRQPLTEWLASELHTRYQVPIPLATSWIETDQVLPLLDGLDEVAAAHRGACVEAINTYRRAHGLLPTVVCCRQTDYLVLSTRLLLRTAVVMRPLTPEQVESYLTSGGERLEALRQTLREDADLQALASTPLMLNVLTVAYQGTQHKEVAVTSSLERKQEQIFTSYVQRILTRRSISTRYTPEQTTHWLSSLAGQMKRYSQTIFYIEQIQPDWLSGNRMLRVYNWLGVRLPGVLMGVIVYLTISAFLVGSSIVSFIPDILLVSLLGKLLSEGSIPQQPTVSGKKAGSALGPRLLQWLLIGALIGLGSGLSVGRILGPDVQYIGLSDVLSEGLCYGLSYGICSILLQFLLRKNSTTEARSQTPPPAKGMIWQRLIRRREVYSSLLVGLILWLGLSFGPNIAAGSGMSPGLSNGLSAGLGFVLSAGVLSALLIGRSNAVQPTDLLVWSWRSLGKSLFAKSHVSTTVQITVLAGLLVGLSFGLSVEPVFRLSAGLTYGLSEGLGFGLSYWFLLGLFQGVSSATIADQRRVVPNQGIRRSALNGLVFGLISAITVGLLVGLSFGLSNGLIFGLSEGLTTAALFDDRVETGEKNALLYLAQRQVRLELCSNLL